MNCPKCSAPVEVEELKVEAGAQLYTSFVSVANGSDATNSPEAANSEEKSRS